MRKEAKITACDWCGDDGKSWTLVAPNGDRYYVDACDRHGTDLRHACDVGKPAKRGPFGTRAVKLSDA